MHQGIVDSSQAVLISMSLQKKNLNQKFVPISVILRAEKICIIA
jgi:hypothetical protein